MGSFESICPFIPVGLFEKFGSFDSVFLRPVRLFKPVDSFKLVSSFASVRLFDRVG